MTITEAAQLVIQSGAMSMGGEVFILDMGESVKIIDLAKQMVELSGMSVQDEQNIDGDIKIEITGLRPGEKLYEELLIGNNSFPTSHPRIRKTQEDFIPLEDLEGKLTLLETALNINDACLVRLIMEELVAGYTPSGEIVDWVFMEQGAKVNKMTCRK
jgi:FlaA1/EpsC-like NDP-sugar epimerase